MSRTTRRQFLTAVGATGAMVALERGPAWAQKRELTLLSNNHFVPASDDELRRQAEAFGKQAGITVRVDTIAGLQLPAKRAAEAQSQTGHDMVLLSHADPFLFENNLVDVGPLVDSLGKKYGGWYPFAAESAQTNLGWRAVPWYWVSFPATYNMAHFKKTGLEPPKTWEELLKQGKVLKKQGNPIGIAISHTGDANTTFWAVLWGFGGKVLEADGKTPAIVSDKTAAAIEWYKEAYKDAMEPEVLSWDDASNNRGILSGKYSWIHNPISPYNTALKEKMAIADDINHHITPAGPAGHHNSPGINAIGIWKFSKNVEPAKEFIQFMFLKENFDAFIVAAMGFNMAPLRNLAEHPIWAKNPKLSMLPKEAEFAHARGWPSRPNDAVRRVENNYVLPDMVAKTLNGMPTKRAMDWAQAQVVDALKGQLKASG
jgi:multiple sugar transport system substrate-binding protein